VNHRLRIGALALILFLLPQLAQSGPHLFYADEAGNINWRPTYAAALAAAKKTGRPIFVQFSKEDHKPSEDQVAVLRDERITQILNRYYVAVSVDYDKPPAELKNELAKTVKPGAPFLLFLTDRGEGFNTLTGTWKAEQIQEYMLKALLDKGYNLPKSKQADAAKQVEALEKAIEQKSWSKATQTFRSILALSGYSPLKDKAYDLMDKAQEGSTEALNDACTHVRSEEYAEAKKVLEKALKTWTALPVADDVKEHLAAVKLLEVSSQQAKANRKADAVRQLDMVISKYSETPYAAVAVTRKKELAPPKDK